MWFARWGAGALLSLACLATGVSRLQAQTVTDPPLSTGEKWEFATGETFAPLAILDLGAGAALRQQQDQFPTFGQGVFGYTKRYGVAFANHAGSDYLTGAVFPILFKEDPRYFRMGTGGFFRRFFYAASRIPVTRTDKGKNRFNFSEIIGNAAAATLSNVYLPRADRTTSYSAETFGLFLGSDALVNIAKEFWPNVRHKLFHGPPADGGSSPSPQGVVSPGP
jgi:hypothetical protein